MGQCFEEYPGLIALEFEHSEALANRIRSMAEAPCPLFPPDVLADTAAAINASQLLPASSVEDAAQHLEFAFPTKRMGSFQEALAAAEYSVAEKVQPILTDE